MSIPKAPSISINMATKGRLSLGRALGSLIAQGLTERDEVLIIADGKLPKVAEAADRLRENILADVRCVMTDATSNGGYRQRNFANSIARGDVIMYLDDDDIMAPGAILNVRHMAEEYPGHPLMFKMENWNHEREVLWIEPKFVAGNISGAMFVHPNHPEKLGTWPEDKGACAGDFEFMNETIKNWGGPEAVVWADTIIYICRPGWTGPTMPRRERPPPPKVSVRLRRLQRRQREEEEKREEEG